MKIGNAPMAYSLGLAIATADKNSVFKTIPGLERNVTMPAKGKISLDTIKDINPADDDISPLNFYREKLRI